MSGVHPSHVTRMSDASTFDEICVNCGATDEVPGGFGALIYPCPNVPEQNPAPVTVLAWATVMAPLGDYWRRVASPRAIHEGWELFDCDGVLQIQGIDCPDDGDAGLAGGDAEAYQLCVTRALAGSKLHLLALFLDGRPSSVGDAKEVPRTLLEV